VNQRANKGQITKENAEAVTQEFHISVTPVGNGEYLVRTEQVAPGVPLAEEQVFWTVEDWLEQARQLMTDPLEGMLQGDGVDRIAGGHELLSGGLSSGAAPLSLRELGQRLYHKLFQGTLRDSWVIAQGIAQHRKEVLRLRLGLKGSALLRLPWEVMGEGDRDPHGGNLRTIATGTDIIFSRYQPGIHLVPEAGATGSAASIQILMVIATPRDRDQLALMTEAENLQQELRQPLSGVRPGGHQPKIELTLLCQPGREQLTQALEQGHYQVLHYAGHSNLGQSGGDLYLVNERTGLTELLSGDDLAGLLVNNGIRMAVFNSCRGGYTASPGALEARDRNLAEALVSRGIPAVLAMAERIPDEVALVLTRLFYRNLRHGYPIDLSLSRARQGLISSYGSHQIYWALPTLYLHPDFDGYLDGGDRTQGNSADGLMRSTTWMATLDSLKAAGQSAVIETERDTASAEDLALVADGSELDLEDDLGEEPLEQSETVADLVRQLADPLERRAAAIQVAATSLPLSATANTLTATQTLEPLSSGESVATAAAAPPSASVAAAAAASAAKQTSSRKSTVATKRRRVPMLTVIGVGAIALLGGIWWRFSPGLNEVGTPASSVASLETAPPELPPSITEVDLETASPQTLTQLAISLLNQGDMLTAETVVEALLNRGAIAEAEAALEAVPPENQEDASVYFLKGRLHWEGLRTQAPTARLSEARTTWERAVELRPNQVNYHIALGFAYHAEDRPREAVQSWLQALELLENQSPTSLATSTAAPLTAEGFTTPQRSPIGQDMTNLYAGIAIGLFELSKRQPPEQQAYLRDKALKVYETATTPQSFDPTQSPQHWLWMPPALEQWRALQKL
jgi:tetratricopeptide (TPR) repeat protein